MAYDAPMKDMLFSLEYLSNWSDVGDLPHYSHVDHDDIRAVLKEFARFCSELIAPLSSIGDEVGAQLVDNKVVLPEPFGIAYQEFVKMGWQRLTHSVDYGGMGFPGIVGAAATEMLNSADLSFGLCPLLTDGAIHLLDAQGSKMQKDRYLPKLISGEWSATMNLTEPQAGSDLGRICCKAKPVEGEVYRIFGTKIFITYGDHELSDNIIHLVLARTPGAAPGSKGLSLFIVPKYLESADGTYTKCNDIQCSSLEHKLGVRASPTAILEYEGAKGYLIGEEGHGLTYMFVMMMNARFAVGMQGVAISERAYQQALAFAAQRIQGRALDGSDSVAIKHHPDVRRMLMRMKALTEGCRALAYSLAGWMDLGKYGEDTQRPLAQSLAEFLAPLVKAYCTEKAVEITSLNIQIHGGMGFVEETGAAQLYRDARILPIYEGTTGIQANDFLRRKILHDGGGTACEFANLVAETERLLMTGSIKAKKISVQLQTARKSFETSLDWLLETAPKNMNAAFSGAHPFLMLTSNLATCWQLGRSVLVAEAKIRSNEDTEFMTSKVTTALFYAQHVLVDVMADGARVIAGVDNLIAANNSAA
ncbi:3-methylmercaptopropionyl-CoA dehydrogenase [Cohaesibacter gelatinilyticus]|uniref:3-methylmercaptopropionyl-CoA dehydrogenase n=2 Tax=Cohaesibacter gelatinilyticus TaxID=372072 RepID=A0A285PNQ8_9HYPH|nr:3-methylmercaptopropionyl-CoA dehydrogenase [Cohaesibacter gelatinilyticus]